ncbi:MAG: hypothetical protein C0507_22205 [Cyanobacteria bacterium PR.3.49]|jgi:tetratricopeptide (TPR) repeat protein|nr:hypothetical protein [Cyanobacteria bacterium PR.3.49]
MKRWAVHVMTVAFSLQVGTLACQAETAADKLDTFRMSMFHEPYPTRLDLQALDLLKKHEKHMEESNAPESELLPVMSALALLLRTSDRETAVPLFKKCLAIREKLGDKSSDDYKNELQGYAEAAYCAGDLQTAEEMLEKLIPLATEYDVKHKLKFDLVECYTRHDNISRAEHLMLATLKQNDSVGQCFSSEMLGAADWYANQQRFDEAKSWYLKAIAKAKTENDSAALRKAESSMKRYFVKETKPADVMALLKQTSPKIRLNENNYQLDLGDDNGVHYGMNFATDTKDGKPNEEDWLKQYKMAVQKLNQRNYAHAETLFRDGSNKYRGTAEAVAFDVGLAKLYQEMNNQPKLRETLAMLVKNGGNGNGPPVFKTVKSTLQASGNDAKAKAKPAKESKRI